MAEPQTGERPSVSRGVGGGGLQGVVAVGGAGLGQGGSGEDGVGDGLFGALDALCGFDDFVDAVGGHDQGAVCVGADPVPGVDGDPVDQEWDLQRAAARGPCRCA